MGWREHRLAENQSLFRSANERIESRMEAVVEAPDERVPFLCECARIECNRRIPLTLAEYERTRSDPSWFIVAPGHELPEVDEVIERRERYLLVRKFGDAQVVAEELDERS